MVFRLLYPALAFDFDVQAYRASVQGNGGTVSDARMEVINTFVAAEKVSGAWPLTDDYWGLWAESEIQALTSIKQRRLATAVNTPIFTTDRDYATNGTTSYINTGFIPSTHAVAYTTGQQRIAVYERTNVTSAGMAAGAIVATTNRVSIIPRNSTVMTGTLNNSAIAMNFTLGLADSKGLKAVSRAGGTTGLGYDRGVRLTDSVGLTVTSAIQNIAVFIGCQNNAGAAANFRAASLGFAAIGAPLSDAQELAQYNAVQAWATSVGANV